MLTIAGRVGAGYLPRTLIRIIARVFIQVNNTPDFVCNIDLAQLAARKDKKRLTRPPPTALDRISDVAPQLATQPTAKG